MIDMWNKLFKPKQNRKGYLKEILHTEFKDDLKAIEPSEPRTLKKFLDTKFEDDLVSFEKPMFHLNIQRIK